MEDFDEPHSDEAIEVCLERFKVEVLDWQKVDLCPGVISKIGSHLREVSLHWSGRNAVLRGWSEQYGLVQCPKLIRINLQFPKNLATSNRTMQNISIFKERLSKFRTSNNSIEVTYDHDLNSSWGLPQTYSIQAPIMKNENAGQYNMQEWIRCIDSFSQKIQNIDPKKALSNELLKNIPSYLFKDVVVAVIDDGVDIGNRALRGKIDGGKSFDTGPQGHYRSSTNNHGTVMASMIVRVCPKVKIYVVKLQTYMSESAIQIDIQSAAKAIQAAVDHGVDIISMSWSVKKPDENTAEKNALDQALENAKDKGILLFCSSGDRGDLETETYPGAYSGGTIFRIGAATATGKGREGTPELSRINYLLPGFEIPERKPKGVKADLYTGSSVSTALAAGLAALVRHCIRLGVIWTKTASVEERDRYRVKIDEKKLDSMRTPGEAFKCMNYAFQQFGLNENNHKYIEVWKLLEKDEFISRWKGTQAERLREIAKLGQLFTGIF
ncbi:Major intracellular serine protease [Daldinia childiae]|nr:Major intracellular serine protease [Daldinia childiae]KAF3063842.1 Major intracellular serine protease [Daldinia childiae]